MTRRGRWITLMLHRDGNLASRSIRMPLWLGRVLAVAGVALSVVVVLGGVLYAPIARTAARVPGLNRELTRLQQENGQVRELAAALEQMEARYEQVRTMLGGDLVPARVRSYDAPVARAVRAALPGAARRYETGLSIPGHWPLDETGIVTRGLVSDADEREPHSGLDIAIPVGTPIRATGGGTVSDAGQDPEYGLFVMLEHAEGYRSMYGHASRILVEVGDTVTAGAVIALSGSTGRSTAPHLHFEILREGRSVDPLSLVQEGI